jgi:N-acyl homoserine lactone hydrolase
MLEEILIVCSIMLLAGICALLWIFRAGFQSFKTTPYAIPSQATPVTWAEVFAKPAAITVKAVKTGSIAGDRASALNPQHSYAAKVPNRSEPVPEFIYYLQHQQAGDMLIDAGFDHSFSAKPPFGNLNVLVKTYLKMTGRKYIQQPGQDVNHLLNAKKIKLQKVFFTHLHADHTAGVPALPDESEYVFGAREDHFLARATMRYHFQGKSHLKTLTFNQACSIPPFSRVIDLLGDGSLWALSTAGHTRDHISYLINSRPHPTLVVGDAIMFQWALENKIAPFTDDGKPESQARAEKSLQELCAFVEKYPQVQILYSHDEV